MDIRISLLEEVFEVELGMTCDMDMDRGASSLRSPGSSASCGRSRTPFLFRAWSHPRAARLLLSHPLSPLQDDARPAVLFTKAKEGTYVEVIVNIFFEKFS
jgi:hypothetical protein